VSMPRALEVISACDSLGIVLPEDVL
jgi:hypothetical protein